VAPEKGIGPSLPNHSSEKECGAKLLKEQRVNAIHRLANEKSRSAFSVKDKDHRLQLFISLLTLTIYENTN
jgi:hypothetical protein